MDPFSKAKFAIEKKTKCSGEVVVSREANKRSLEDTPKIDMRSTTLAKEKDAIVKKMEVTLKRKEVLEKEREANKAKASSIVDAFKKTLEFIRDAENHYLARLIKIYGDWITHIRGVQPVFTVDQVKGLKALLKLQKHENEVATRKDKGKPASEEATQIEADKPEESGDHNGFSDSNKDDAKATT